MNTHGGNRLSRHIRSVLFGILLSGMVTAARAAEAPGLLVPDQPQTIMPVDDVRVGMKGYGLTVFHGTKIEPFPIEVLSIVRDQGPKRAVIWVNCDDPRLLESGPVQGMSGSPMYLWDEGEPQTLGEGGRLIGAFAFGYTWDERCTAGVQPIELMRNVGDRITDVEDQSAGANGSMRGLLTLNQLQRLANAHNVPASRRYKLDLLQRLLSRAAPNDHAPTVMAQLPAAPTAAGRVMRMFLPITVGSLTTAELTNPLLEPFGMTVVASGAVGGAPPPSVDAETTRIQPGSVLSIPLAFGDLDLAASGTVTDVLPDGTVLGFGHAMFGQGPTAIPLATGYVHFIAARAMISFKVSGSLNIVGSIVEDENSAVAGITEHRYQTAPLRVHVELPNQPPRSYEYKVVDHPLLTPTLAAICILESAAAVQDLPIENTMRVETQMSFTGDRAFEMKSVTPSAMVTDLVWSVMPAIASMMQNPYDQLKLESMDVRVSVEPRVMAGTIIGARLDQATVEPGEKFTLSFQVQPYGEPVQTHRAEVAVPVDTPEGDYQLIISGAMSYAGRLFATRPHLFNTTTIDELYETMRLIMSIRDDAAYVGLQLAEKGIAVGRAELPQLPSSRRAMIATPTSTTATPFIESVEQVIETDMVVNGDYGFLVHVRKPNSELPVP